MTLDEAMALMRPCGQGQPRQEAEAQGPAKKASRAKSASAAKAAAKPPPKHRRRRQARKTAPAPRKPDGRGEAAKAEEPRTSRREAQILEFMQANPARSASARSRAPSASRATTASPSRRCSKGSGRRRQARAPAAGSSSTLALPPVAVIEVTGIDRRWRTDRRAGRMGRARAGKPPRVLYRVRKRQRRPRGAATAGQATGCWRRSSRPATRITVSRRASFASLPTVPSRVLGVFRIAKGHGARIIPVDKKARNELQVQPAMRTAR